MDALEALNIGLHILIHLLCIEHRVTILLKLLNNFKAFALHASVRPTISHFLIIKVFLASNVYQ